jgi:ATPase family AAA domain-containing protein 2
MAPKDFPDLANRKKRKLEDLPKAPPPPPKVLSDDELRNWKAKDRETLHWLIFRLKPSVEGSSTRMRKLRKGVVDQSSYPDVFAGEPKEDSPYELVTENGETKVLERATGKKFYNISLITIEDRLINGFYKTPDTFLEDCKRLRRDAKVLGEDRDRERWLKANEFFGNAELLVSDLKNTMPGFIVDCENMAMRERIRQERRMEKQEQVKAIEAPKTRGTNENEDDKSGESHQTNGIADEGNQTIDVGEVTALEETQTDLTNGPRGQSSPRPTSTSQPIEVAHRLADISGLTGLGSFTSQAEVSQAEISQVERVEVSRVEEVHASQPDRSHSSATKSTQSTSQADSMKANAGSNDESTGPSGESQSQIYQPGQLQAILMQQPKAKSQESLIAKQGSQQMTTQSTESLFEIAATKRMTTGNPLNDSQGSQDLPSGDTRQLSKSMESNASVNHNSSGNTASNGTERDHSDNPHDKSQLDFSTFLNSSGDSQVPETQSNSSSQDAASLAQLLSSPPGPVITSVAAERRMLTLRSGNSGNSASNSQTTTQPAQSQEHEFQTPAVPQQRLKVDEELFTRIREDLTEMTDGFSVENLEQVMATVMSTVWRYKSDWDRTHVAKEVLSAANEAINDIKEMEKSMNSQQSG